MVCPGLAKLAPETEDVAGTIRKACRTLAVDSNLLDDSQWSPGRVPAGSEFLENWKGLFILTLPSKEARPLPSR